MGGSLHLRRSNMIRRLGLCLGAVLVTLALASSPVQAGTCTDNCFSFQLACQRNCGHVITCTQQCRDGFNICNCHNCGIC